MLRYKPESQQHMVSAVGKVSAANDNEPRRYLVGAGNITWERPTIPDMSRDEVYAISEPLRILHGWAHEAGTATRKSGDYAAVYAISDIYGDATKIGKAADPMARLAQLQTGNPSRLFLHRVFWLSGLDVSTTEAIDAAERRSHEIAAEEYPRLEGEWFACAPSEAHRAIELAIGELKAAGRVGRYCVMTPPNALWKAA